MFRRIAAVVVMALPMSPGGAAADVVKLRSGGELRGTVVEGDESAGRDAVAVETLTGGVVAVSRGDVEFVTRRPKIVEEYEVLAKSADATAEGQWRLAEWCREHDLDEQRREHLLRVVDAEPEHAAARSALKQTKHDGEWLTREEIMEKRGLVSHKGRWITPQELDLIEKTREEREREQAWTLEIRKFKAWVKGNNPSLRRKGADGLRAVADADAVPALERLFLDDPDPEVRKLYLAALARIGGGKAVKPLVTQSLHDVDHQVRYAALEALDEDQYAAALPYYLQGLRNGLNDVVRRAGTGLQKVGDERAVPDLMKALVTKHSYRVQVRDDSTTYSFSKNGAFGVGGTPLPPEIEAGLRTGQLPYGAIVLGPNRPVPTKTVTIAVNHENPEVLSALRRITGETFGYDERTWRLWWAAKKNGAG